MRHSLSGLAALTDRHPRFRGGCYLVTPDAPVQQPDDTGGIGTMPVDVFLAVAGRQAEAALLAKVSA